MLDFGLIRSKAKTIGEMTTGLKVDDLRSLTHEMIDCMLSLIAGCTDADVTFQPIDPAANDLHAANPADVKLAWTLGHIIVHSSASSEESAALAAELARGVIFHGRSRYEIPWQTVKTMAACKARMQESLRIRLASLEMWPDSPHLDNLAEIIPGRPPMNAQSRFVMGLMHDDSHLGQISEIIRQAHVTRLIRV